LKRKIETPCRSGNERDRLGLGLRRSKKRVKNISNEWKNLAHAVKHSNRCPYLASIQ
jgi:hypothetical protein